MKKIVCLILALLSLFVFASCNNWSSTITDYSGEVSSNGGFAVVKGDYVYFINGSQEYDVENKFGEVTKGALVRAKVSDIGKENAVCEMVVPKLVYSDYRENNAGIYIFGDYVYYPTPCDDLDKASNVKNNFVEFTKTKLDGTDTVVLATVEGLSTPYRFIEKGGKVYLTVYTTIEEENFLVTYDSDGNEVFKSQAITSYLFSIDDTLSFAVYAKPAHNDALDQDESFNEVYLYNLDGSGETMILSGAGSYTDAENGIGTQGVTFGLVKLTEENLIVSETYVDTSVSSATRYYGIKNSEIKVTDGEKKAHNLNYDALILLNKGTTEASSIFASNSIYVSLNCIIYIDSVYGFLCYDYTEQDNVETFGRVQLLSAAKFTGYNYAFNDKDYIYYADENAMYQRLKISDLVDTATGEPKAMDSAAFEQMTFVNTSGYADWYRFEYVGNYMLVCGAFEPFYDYVYAVDYTLGVGKTEEELEDMNEKIGFDTKEEILDFAKYRLAVVTEEDKEAFNTFMEENYPEEETSSSTAE